MAASRPAGARNVVWTIHRWIGVLLLVLLAPISLSGALLVFDDQLDSLLHPARYAVSGNKVALPPSMYLANAGEAVPPDMQPTLIRFPQDEGAPVTVMARGAAGAGGPPRLITVYLDPPTGRVLDTNEFRSSFIGILHRFHENLTIPEYSGRQIVGWVGVGLLALSLTGIWLWWPRNGAFFVGLRWRRAPATITNLHHLFGFWISLPLAVVSLTGVYLAFPPQARSLMSSVTTMSPPQRPGFGPVARSTNLGPDRALAAALAIEPQASPLAVFLPPATRGSEGGRSDAPPPSWRVQARLADGDATILVNDQSGVATRLGNALPGDRAAQWIRWLHEGSHSGVIWRFIVFMTGVFPAVLGVTGVIMWLRGRKRLKTRSADVESGVVAAPSASTAE